jgi:LysM repeat protein
MSVPAKQIKKIIPAKYHRVKSGETLSEIAERYGLSTKELKRKNHLRNNKISIKQQLKIKDEQSIMILEPVKVVANQIKLQNDSSAQIKSDIVNQKVENSISTPKTHIVKKGESLFSISKIYNVSIDNLKKSNNLETGKIIPGQKLSLELNTEIAMVEKLGIHIVAQITTHKVKPGETLSAISKKFNVSINDLKKMNNLTSNAIQIHQEIKIRENVEGESALNQEDISKSIKYKVKKGESLFTISKRFNVSVDDLKTDNNLNSNAILIGQELIVNTTEENVKTSSKQGSKITHKVKSGESYYSLAKKYGCSIDEIKAWNNKSGNKLNIGDKVIIHPK